MADYINIGASRIVTSGSALGVQRNSALKKSSSDITTSFKDVLAAEVTGAVDITQEKARLPVHPSYYANGLSAEEVRAKINELKISAEEMDYSGMTDVEIYNAIRARYTDAFGEDFEQIKALKIGAVGTGTYNSISNSFRRELKSQFGKETNIEAVKFKSLYGDMSSAEAEAAIRAKYPDNLTNRELCLMSYDLYTVNLGGGDSLFWAVNGYMHDITAGNLGTATIETFEKWLAVLDDPVSTPTMLSAFNGYKAAGSPWATPELEAFLSRLFDRLVNIDGFFDWELWE